MANTLIVDSREAVLKESGDVFHSGATIDAEAGELIGNQYKINRSDTAVLKSVRIAVQDIATARHVYQCYVLT